MVFRGYAPPKHWRTSHPCVLPSLACHELRLLEGLWFLTCGCSGPSVDAYNYILQTSSGILGRTLGTESLRLTRPTANLPHMDSDKLSHIWGSANSLGTKASFSMGMLMSERLYVKCSNRAQFVCVLCLRWRCNSKKQSACHHPPKNRVYCALLLMFRSQKRSTTRIVSRYSGNT